VQFKAVCFDLDGTLLDSLHDIAYCTNKVLIKWGLPSHNLETIRKFVGEGLENLITNSLPEKSRKKNLINECQKDFQKIYRETWFKNTTPYKEIPKLLDELCKKRIKLAILSNKPQEFVSLAVNRLLSNWKFELVLGQQNDIPKKPNPDGFFLINKKLKLTPKEFALLGDTETDMQTAVVAGCYPIGVLWGFRSEKVLIDNGAKIIIKEPLELLDIIN
tara:strand:+ start:38 stop:691 length:654 start_codon:yes stop_codon:yes gene_type:complete